MVQLNSSHFIYELRTTIHTDYGQQRLNLIWFSSQKTMLLTAAFPPIQIQITKPMKYYVGWNLGLKDLQWIAYASFIPRFWA